jgi:hypothetical protein
MKSIQVQIYRQPCPEAEVEGVAELRRDIAAHYWLNNVKVVTAHTLGAFTELACVDNRRHYVCTAAFDQAAQADELACLYSQEVMMTFICSDRNAEATVQQVLTHYGLTKGHSVLKTGPSKNDPAVFLSIQGEVPVELREVLRTELGSMPGIVIQEGL